MNLKDALKSLDKNDKSNFTNDGQPRLDVLSKLVGRQVTRDDLKNASKTSESKTVGSESSEDNEKSLKEEMKKASERLREAQKAYDEATAKFDRFLIEGGKDKARLTTAHDIKAFQKAQFEQRKLAATNQAKINKMLQGMS